MIGRRILIVEDEPGLVITLSDRLVNEGYVVNVATDGEAGLELALKEVFDLIILDIMLPKKNGFDVCRDLRQQNIQTPIIMLTARGQVIDKVLGLKLGADDYVVKPFEADERHYCYCSWLWYHKDGPPRSGCTKERRLL